MANTWMVGPQGKLFEVAPEHVEQYKQQQGWTVATPEVVTKMAEDRERYSKHGSTGQQGLAAVETAIRAGTLGAVDNVFGTEEESHDRGKVLSENSPIIEGVAQAVPGLAAAVGVGALTGGAGLPAVMAAQGAVGGVANVGAAADAAYKRDQELSAEEAFSAFGSGMLLGAGAELGVAGLARAGRGVRNRLVEVTGKMSRAEEASVLSKAGVHQPHANLGKAVEDDAVAAGMRGDADRVRATVRQEVADALGKAQQVEDAVKATRGSVSGEATGDVFAQRSAMRDVAEKVSREDPGLGRRLMDRLDASNTSDELFSTSRYFRDTIDDGITRAASKEVVEKLRPLSTQARSITENSALFGRVGDDVAAFNAKLDGLGDSRVALEEALKKNDIASVYGTQGGKDVQDALEAYTAKLEDVIKSSPDESVKQGQEVIDRIRGLQEGNLKTVAGGNQVDLLGKPLKADKSGSSPLKSLLGEVGETVVESMIPGYGLARKAFKYAKHIAKLSGAAKEGAETTARQVLQNSMIKKAQGVVGRARVPQSAVRAATQAITLPFRGVPGETPEQQYTHVKSLVEDLSNNPEKLADSMLQDFGDLPEEAPELYMAIAERASRAVSFLKAKVPTAFTFNMMYPDGPPASQSDIIQMGLYWNGATSPKETLQSIANGTAMPEQVEAAQAVAPAMFEEFRDNVVIDVQQMARDGKTLGAYQIAQLEGILGMPGALDPTFSTEVAQIYQAGKAIETQQKQASYRPPPKAGSRIEVNQGYTRG
jgi:hypothetical protein